MKLEELEADTSKRIEAALAEGLFTKAELAIGSVAMLYKLSRGMVLNASTDEQRAFAVDRIDNAFADMTMLAGIASGVTEDRVLAAADFILSNANEQTRALGGVDAAAMAENAMRAYAEQEQRRHNGGGGQEA